MTSREQPAPPPATRAGAPAPPASSAAWPRCSRAASSWTSSPPSRRRSPRTPAPSPSWRSSGSPPTSARRAASSRMSDPDMIDGIIEAVSIPVMAKARIGHFVEAQVLQSLGVDYVDESEVLTPADYANHIDKWAFTVPFVCGATNLGEALRRITEGAAMIRSKGEAGTGDVSNATTHMRKIRDEIRRLTSLPRGRAVRRRQGAAGAVRPGQGGRRGRQAPRRAVHRRRHRDPGRRRDDDAARRRGRLRRLRHLQVRQPGRSAPRRSSRRPRSTTTPT